MSVTSGLGTTLDIINIAGTLVDPKNPRDKRMGDQLDSVRNRVGQAARVAERMDRAGGAITSLSSQTTILSRVFIDESVADEPILPNLMRSAHSWYSAQIIAALHLSQMVDSHRTVQDVMAPIQTGHNNRERSLLGNIAARRMGQESFLTNYMGKAPEDFAGLEALQGPLTYVQTQAATADQWNDRVKNNGADNGAVANSSVAIRSVDTAENRVGPMGELYEVKLTNPNDKNASITVPIFIQMQPSIVPAHVAPRFIDMNVAPPVWQRWTMMRAGELAFWNDFVRNKDLIQRQKSLIKDPSTAKAFSDFLRTVAKKDKYAIDDVSDRFGSRQSSNLANSVVVFSEDAVAQAKVDSGVDLHSARDRARYFRDSYTMIIAIIDPLHQRVMVYFNGLDGSIDASYNEFRPKDSKFDPKDFMTALQAFSSNNIGRLR